LASSVDRSKSYVPPDRPTSDLESVHVGLTVAECIKSCDCKAETVETLVSLLEHRQSPLLQVEGWFYDRACVAPRRRSLQKIAAHEPVARAILECAVCNEAPAGDDCQAEDESFTASKHSVVGAFGSYSFSVTHCANFLGSSAEPRHVFAALRRMEQCGDIELALDVSDAGRGLNLKTSNAGLHILRIDNVFALDELTAELTNRLNDTVTGSCNKVIDLNFILRQVASSAPNEADGDKSASLSCFQRLIREYFVAEGQGKLLASKAGDFPLFSTIDRQQLQVDVHTVLTYLSSVEDSLKGDFELRLQECPEYAALVVTKFLHGLQTSARYPISLMWQHILFGRMQSSRFLALREAVEQIICN
jgi:hypothetical protein